jgi:NADH-quinone oxidoreductase subunit C
MSDEPRDPEHPPADGASSDQPAQPEATPAAERPPVPAATGASGVGGAATPPPAAATDDAAKAAAAAAAKAKAEAAARAKAEAAAAEAAKPPWERDPVAPAWKEAAGDPLADALESEFGDAIEWARTLAGDLTVKVRRERVQDVAAALKRRHGFNLFVDCCGADYPKQEPRFEVIWNVYSLEGNRRVRLKVSTDEATPVPSLVPVWRGANWPEREVYDMFGVRFADHPDMTRILMWEGFNGHPLRKDFPVEGIDTGSAIYPEYYDETAGPVAGTGTGWRPK